MRDRMLALLARHHAQFGPIADQIDEGVRDLGASSVEAREDLHRAAHSLKGSAGSMGYAGVSQAAERLEQRLRAVIASGPTEAEHRTLEDLSAALSGTVARTPLDASTLYKRFA